MVNMRLPYKPFSDDASTVLYFEGQSPGRKKPYMPAAWLDSIDFLTMNVQVDNRPPFDTREMTSLALASLGAKRELIRFVTKIRDSDEGHMFPLWNAYRHLGTSAVSHRTRTQATRLAYKRGLFLPDPDAEQKIDDVLNPLRPHLRERIFILGQLAGEGLSDADIGDILEWKQTTVINSFYQIHKDLYIDTPTIVMLTGAVGLFPKDEESLSIAA